MKVIVQHGLLYNTSLCTVVDPEGFPRFPRKPLLKVWWVRAGNSAIDTGRERAINRTDNASDREVVSSSELIVCSIAKRFTILCVQVCTAMQSQCQKKQKQVQPTTSFLQ